MRSILAALVVAAGVAAMAPSADACSIRGQFCGYPAWAANAFEHPRNRVNLGSGPVLPTVAGGYEARPRYYATRHRHHRRARR